MMPTASLAIEKDYYQVTTLRGTIGLLYAKDKTKSGRQTSGTKTFQQLYTLNLQGKLLARRLIIYNVGMSASRVSVNNVRSTSKSRYQLKTTSYNYSTTILPKSAIPLNMFGSHTTSGNTGARDSATTYNMYGLNWRIKLRRLPEMNLSVNKTRSAGARVDNSNNSYKFNLKAKVGITENRFSYAKDTRAENYSKSKHTSTLLTYHNRTALSKRTKINADAAMYARSSRPGSSNNNNSVSVNLNSIPGEDFSQNHSYSFESQKATGKAETTTYDGDVAYTVTERLSTTFRLSERSFSSTAGKSERKYSIMDMVDAFKYRLTRSLSWVGSFKYGTWKNNSPDASVNSRDRVREQLDTGLAYRRRSKGYALSGAYRLGYLEERAGTDPNQKGYGRKRGLSQTAALGLTKVRPWNVVLLNASGQYAQAKNRVKDIFMETTYYHLDISNIAGRKYAVFKAHYDKKITEAWTDTSNTRTDSYGASVTSKYFKRTTLSLSDNRVKSSSRRGGLSRADKLAASVSHRRASFLGSTNFKLTANRSTTVNEKSRAKSVSDSQSATISQKLSYFKKTDMSLSVRRSSLNNGASSGSRSMNIGFHLNHSRRLLGGSFGLRSSISSSSSRYRSPNNGTSNGERSRNIDFHLSYGRRLLGGSLNSSYSILSVSRSYLKVMEKYRTQKFAATYARAIISNISWQGRFSKSKTKGRDTIRSQTLPDETEFGSTLYCRLRDWLFSADYSNKVSKTETYKITDNRVVFTLTREFIRIW